MMVPRVSFKIWANPKESKKKKKLVWIQFWIHFKEENVLEREEDSDSLIHDWWIMGDFMSQLCNILYHINILNHMTTIKVKYYFIVKNISID